MATEKLNVKKKNDILSKNSVMFQQRIAKDVMFLAQLTSAKVITPHRAQDIQAITIPGDIRKALYNDLLEAGVECFIDFCIVLYDEQNKRDVVEEDFGLNIADLRHQKEEIEQKRKEEERRKKEEEKKKEGAPVPKEGLHPTTGVARVKQLQETETAHARCDNLGEDTVDIGRNIFGEDKTRDTHLMKQSGLPARAARTGRGLADDEEPEDVEMRDDTGDDGVDIRSKLNPHYHWMGREYKRLRDSLEGKNAKPVVIALLDTGVNTEHPDLQDIIGESRNFIWTMDEAGNPTVDSEDDKDLCVDDHNHGTVSAGIIWQYAGEKNVKILNFKVGAHTGKVNSSDVARALKHIDDNPSLQVDIILMTFGYKGYDEDVDTLLAKMGEKKILIASAGNDGQQLPDTVLSPAKHGSVIAVGACNYLNERVGYSGIGKKLDFLFSGQDIVSTSSKYHINMSGDEVDRYISRDGTSFAAPHCAALVALVLAYVETQFPRDGVQCREKLTKSSCMGELLASFCKTDPTANKGYGTPIFEDLVKDLIGHHMKKILSFQEIQ